MDVSRRRVSYHPEPVSAQEPMMKWMISSAMIAMVAMSMSLEGSVAGPIYQRLSGI
jgi:hypothetical protein